VANWQRHSPPHGRCVRNAPSLTRDRLGRCDQTVMRTPRGRHCRSARGGDKLRTGGLCRRRGHTARRSGRVADVGRPAAMGVVAAPPVVAAADVGRIGKLTAPVLGSFGAPPPGAMVEGSVGADAAPCPSPSFETWSRWCLSRRLCCGVGEPPPCPLVSVCMRPVMPRGRLAMLQRHRQVSLVGGARLRWLGPAGLYG
jgi:hypothetical protein